MNIHPYSRPKFKIRQVHPASNGKRLFVLDGILVPDNKPNFLTTIRPTDIKSITVLNDAVGVALYGERGADGVVQITTKQGAKLPLNIKK